MFRVYISNKIGAEGMGLYQLIFSLYTLVATFATSGISVAVTRLVTDKADIQTESQAQSGVKKAIAFSVCLGLLAMLVLYFGAKPASIYWLKDERAVSALKILSPGLPFMAASAALWGYFVAKRNVSLQSASQVLEQAVRIGIVLFAFGALASGEIEKACVFVMLGNMISEICACLYMALGYWRDIHKLKKPLNENSASPAVLKSILSVALPIAGVSYVKSILHTFENVLVPDRLTVCLHSKSMALAQFGALKSMTMPVILFPSSFLVALAMLLVPEVSQANAEGKTQRIQYTVRRSLQVTMLLSIFIAGGFWEFQVEVGQLLYKSSEVSFYIGVLAPYFHLCILKR